ncbi:glycoside hydrolase family 13 protein [uncultured Draconibacterium sp.]|uniref:glycoside hydrolase family 13 protein n=1 Tax=uncultured Draconibacterium sp. TaxID=1573823 RepID=UPI002AA6E44B|nr:glycoside hydrolase family 13 protein [uncultured Draconibacterium sp.]
MKNKSNSLLNQCKKNIILSIFLLGCSLISSAIDISRVEPSFWWVGMQNTELQILVYGDQIANSKVSFEYPGVRLKEVVNVENPNYLFIYLDVTESAKPGKINIEFTEGEEKTIQPFELKARNSKPGALGFSPADVLYLITPDRFANGDPSNDNLEGARVSREGAWGRHGGDLRGIINNFDYLQDLGITTVWLNPVQKNGPRSYHGYAISDFYQVDPRYGTNDEYIEMIDKAHNRGMKVVMDMIFNHCGGDHWWMKDLPTSDWLNNNNTYVQTNHNKWSIPDVHAPESEKKRFSDGWFNRGMPDLNQKNRHLATYLIQNSIWWIEYTRIDGIRQDTHPYADYDFMARWCKEVTEEYPDFNIVGESWYPRGPGLAAWWQGNAKVSDSNSHLKTAMDFNLTFISQTAFAEENDPNDWHTKGLFRIYESLAQDFLYTDLENILIFLDNHDLGRFSLKEDEGLWKYKQGIAFILTTRGIPQLYYGTEILMTGTKEEGDGVIRTDFPGGWEGDPINAFTAEGRSAKQNEAWDYMSKLLHWRKSSKAVTEGKLVHYSPSENDCYVYAKVNGDDTVLVILNGSDEERIIDTDRYSEVIGSYTKGVDVATEQVLDLSSELKIPARGVYVMDLK